MRRRLLWNACGAGLLLLAAACGGVQHRAPTGPEPIHRPRVVDRVPHDPEAFTQGLLIDGDVWLESTGLYGESDLREVRRDTGEVLRKVPLDPRHFGEGLALFGGRLYQLTWRERVAIVYDRDTLEEVERFRYSGEGWGLTNNDRYLFMSDGSATIRVINPETFRTVRTFEVHGYRGPVNRLNEMAWIDGEIWANIFETKLIVRFDPRDGRVIGFLDLSHLPLPEDVHGNQDVLNGIAFDPETGGVWVTGKRWRALYQLEWPPPASAE